MLMRKARGVTVGLMAAVLVAACSSGATSAPSTAPAPSTAAAASTAPAPSTTAAASTAPAASSAALKANSPYSICLLSQASDTPYSSDLNKAAAAEAAKLGVTLTVLSAEMDAQKQAAQMDTCIAQKVLGVIVVAADAKATTLPSALMAGAKLKPFAWTVASQTRSVLPVIRSRTKMSAWWFVSPGTRFVASD